MYKSEVAAEKMLSLIDSVIRYKSRYIKNKDISKANASLSERQIKILITLSLNENNTVSEMAKFMNISKSTLSIIFTKLIKKGFVFKEAPKDIDDKRKTYFKITEEGIKKLKELGNSAVDVFKKIYASFSEERKKDAALGISKLNVSINTAKNNFYTAVINSQYYKDFEKKDEASKLAFKLFMFFMCFAEYYNSILSEDKSVGSELNELTKNRYNILHCIQNLELNTVSKIEEYTNLSSSSISITISRLVKGGFLYKKYPLEGDDGRKVFICLTQKGLDSIEKTKKNIFDIFKMYFDEFSEEDRENIIDALNHLMKAFQ